LGLTKELANVVEKLYALGGLSYCHISCALRIFTHRLRLLLPLIINYASTWLGSISGLSTLPPISLYLKILAQFTKELLVDGT